MKKILLSLLLFMSIVSFSKAEESNKEPEILYETNLYIIYCIEDYKWMYWKKNTYDAPRQMFKESANARAVPVSCK